MTFEGITAAGTVHRLGTPLSVRITRGADAPADDFLGEFPWSAIPPLYRLRITDGQKTIFYGPVDEQEDAFSQKGAFLRLAGRSMAAILLDNEAAPQTYYSPPFATVFSRHAAPYGFSRYRVPAGGEKIGEFTVTKGMSEWQVLERFCRRAWNAPLSLRNGEELIAGEPSGGEQLLFGGAGLSYLSLTKTNKASERISEVLVRSVREGVYSVSITDAQALRDGVRRRRCMSTGAGLDARRVLARAEQKALEYTLVLPGWPHLLPGTRAVLKNENLGCVDGLQVWSSVCKIDSAGATCTVVLRAAEK